MGEWDESKNPYKILELTKGHETTDDEIKKAFRKLSLQKHPDKQPNNPNAAEEFQEVKRAYELLLDVAAREAWDALEKAKAATARRKAGHADKRRKMMDDLDKRERAHTAEHREEDTARSQLKAELERLRQKHAQERARQEFEGRAARAAADMAASAAAAAQQQPYVPPHAPGPPQLTEEMMRTLKVSWDAREGGYTSAELRDVFAAHGDVRDVVIRESKKKSKGSALVVMGDLNSAARAATATNGRASNPLLVVPFPKVAGVPPDTDATPAAQPPPAAAGARGPGGSLFPLGGGPRPAAGRSGPGPAGFSAGAPPLFPSGRPSSFPGSAASSFPSNPPSSFPSGAASSFPSAPPGSFPGGAGSSFPSSFPSASPGSFPGGAAFSFPSASAGPPPGGTVSGSPSAHAPAGFPRGGAASFPTAPHSTFPGDAAASFPTSSAARSPGAGAFEGFRSVPAGEQPSGGQRGRDFENVGLSRIRQREERERLIAEMKAQDAAN